MNKVFFAIHQELFCLHLQWTLWNIGIYYHSLEIEFIYHCTFRRNVENKKDCIRAVFFVDNKKEYDLFYKVWSSRVASGAFFFTDSMPFSQAAALSYISLLPITWPLVAFRLKNGLPLVDSFRSNFESSCEFLRTDSMPFRQLGLVA